MGELIPSISFSEFKKLNSKQLRRLKSCEITSDGEYLFTFANGNIGEGGYLRMQTENMCQLLNAVGGETVEGILEKDNATL